MKVTDIKSLLIQVLIYTHICLYILYLPITELQMIIFGKQIFSSFHFGIFELLIIILIIINNSSKILINRKNYPALVMAIFLISLWIIGLIMNYNIDYYWKFYYLFYWVVPFIIIIIIYQNKINVIDIKKVLIFIITVHAILIILQHYQNNILWPYMVDDSGNQLFYISNEYYNIGAYMNRCPGLCISGLEAGLLLNFGIVILLNTSLLNKRERILLLIIYFIALFFTGTRNVYIQFIYIILIENVLKLKITNKNKILCVIAITFIMIIFYNFTFINLKAIGISTKSIFTDTLSASIRVENWMKVLSDISQSSIFKILFGQGIWQSAGYNYLIDNMYLELIIAIGILGFISYMFFLIITSIRIGRKYNGYNKRNFYFAFLLSSFIYGVANVLGNLFFCLIILVLLFDENEEN